MSRIATLRRLTGLAVMGVCAAASLPAAPSTPADMLFGDGGTSAFYRWNEPLTKPGVMLRTEAVGDGFDADHASDARRILYSSTDGRFGRGVVEASGLLYLPQGTPPAGGWPLIVWGHGTFGVADVCAPSWKKPTERDGSYVDAWLQQGFAVVAPDYQGLGTRGVHPYLQRKPEGYSTLDAARAALSAFPGKIANRVILTGQSQGSGAVLNATALARGYAPDLRILGTTATALVWRADGTVRPDDVRGLDAPRYLVMRMMGGGLLPGSPAADALLTDKGRRMREAARTGCSRDLVPVAQAGGITAENAFTPSPARAAARLMPLTMANANLGVPLLIATGLADEAIAPESQYRAVRAMCRRGNRITWHTYRGVGHSATSNHALRDAIPFARALLAGTPPASTCASLVAPGALEPRDPAIPFNT